MDVPVVVTEAFIEQGRRKSKGVKGHSKGAWSKRQLSLIGVTWPPKSGWKQRAVGLVIPAQDAEEFLRLAE